MEKTFYKMIEILKLAESPNPELALSSLRMASRLAGGSLAAWLESQQIEAPQARGSLALGYRDELKTLQDEIEWLGGMLRSRSDEIKSLKKEIAILRNGDSKIFDDKEPARIEMQRLRIELKDAKEALERLTQFMDKLVTDLAGAKPEVSL